MKRKSLSLVIVEHLQVSGEVSACPLQWTGMLSQASQASSQKLYAAVCDFKKTSGFLTNSCKHHGNKPHLL